VDTVCGLLGAGIKSKSEEQTEDTMLKIIEGLPPDVMAIEATGKVTHEDFAGSGIPTA
jgi:hypothetical protein